MRDRIYPPKDLECVLDELKDEEIFETKQKGMMFAAALGWALHSLGQPMIEVGTHGEGIRTQYFESPGDLCVVDVLAVAISGELGSLAGKHHEERLATFENLAALGLARLKAELDARRGRSALSVVLAVLDIQMAKATKLPGLGGDMKVLESLL